MEPLWGGGGGGANYFFFLYSFLWFCFLSIFYMSIITFKNNVTFDPPPPPSLHPVSITLQPLSLTSILHLSILHPHPSSFCPSPLILQSFKRIYSPSGYLDLHLKIMSITILYMGLKCNLYFI
jgi:hypothetical protein